MIAKVLHLAIMGGLQDGGSGSINTRLKEGLCTRGQRREGTRKAESAHICLRWLSRSGFIFFMYATRIVLQYGNLSNLNIRLTVPYCAIGEEGLEEFRGVTHICLG